MLFCQIAFFRHKNQRTNSKILCAYVLLSNCFLDIRTKEQVKHLVYLCSSVKTILGIRTKSVLLSREKSSVEVSSKKVKKS